MGHWADDFAVSDGTVLKNRVLPTSPSGTQEWVVESVFTDASNYWVVDDTQAHWHHAGSGWPFVVSVVLYDHVPVLVTSNPIGSNVGPCVTDSTTGDGSSYAVILAFVSEDTGVFAFQMSFYIDDITRIDFPLPPTTYPPGTKVSLIYDGVHAFGYVGDVLYGSIDVIPGRPYAGMYTLSE